jgi:hypothetical protein
MLASITTQIATLCIFYSTCAVAAQAQSVAPPVNNEQDLGTATQLPLIVYSRHYGTPCYADYVPTSKEVGGKFLASVAANEFEPVQIGLYVPIGSEPLKKVRIDIDVDVPHETGYLFFKHYESQWRPIDKGRWYTDYPGGRPSMPLYLVPGSTIELIEPGHTAAFWITFKCDENCQAGIHRGHFTISRPGYPSERHDLEVRIHPFALPRPNVPFSLYYRPDRIPRYWTRKYQERYALDMAEHGLNSGQIASFYPTFGSDEYLANGRVPTPSTAGQWIEPWFTLLNPKEYADGQVDPERLVATQIDIFQRAGLVHSDLPLITVQDNWTCKRKPFIAETFRQLEKKHGWPEILLSTRDEPPPWTKGPGSLSPDDVQGMLEFKRLKNCRTFTAMNGPSALTFGNLHDVWIVLAGQITPELVRESERQQAELWSYSERLRITNLRANRYYAGLYSWGLELKGNTAYSYGHYVFQPKAGEGAVDPVWLPEHGRESLGMVNGFALPGPNGPIPGIGLEGRREGIDDYRYLQLLEARLSPTDSTSQVAREARRWLDGLKQQLRAEANRGVFASGYQHLWELDWVEPSTDFNPVEYAAIRDTSAKYIVQLEAAPGELNQPEHRRELPSSGWEGETFEDSSLPVSIAAMQHGTVSERRAATISLIFKEISEDELPAVIEALVETLKQREVRFPALRAISALGPKASGAMRAIKEQLKAKDPMVRCAALLALESIGPDAVDALISGLEDPFLMNSALAAECLARMGPDAASALPALKAASQSPNEAVRNKILSSIEKIRQGKN